MKTIAMSRSNADPLSYRIFREEDLPGVLRLWGQDSGWGGVTAKQWRDWYMETPFGPCIVVVAIDSGGEIVGQEIFTPSRVTVNGRESLALRISAPILSKARRRASIRHRDHPIVHMLRVGAEQGVKLGYGLIYSLPEHGWLPFFRWLCRMGDPLLCFQVAEFGCVERILSRSSVTSGMADLSTVTALAGEFGPEYEQLWQAAQSAFPIACGTVRSRHWVKFKNQGHLTLEVRKPRDGLLIGYSAIRTGDGLLMDVLARVPSDLSEVLAATVRWLSKHENRAAAGEISTLKAMNNPILQASLAEESFTPVDYTFLLVCNVLDPSLSAAHAAPGAWYVTPGD